jgi:acetyl esterase/lipase
VLYYPVIDTSPEGYGSQAIGERWPELSPLHHVQAGLPPTIVFHGTGDTVTPYVGAKSFCKAMHDSGNYCKLYTNKGGIHGYMMFDEKFYKHAIKKTTSFLKRCGFVNSCG